MCLLRIQLLLKTNATFIINLYYCLLLFMRHLVKINGNVLNLLPISKVKAKTELLLILIYLNNFVS